ncbi:MAG TPA: SpoIIE family protein phosphatase [Nitrospira sp.]|nr:SpoIIE family protein phosphatase [Nitrospira sp.]
MSTLSPLNHSSGHVPEVPTPTVLLVDDEPITRLRLATRLKRLGYRVLEAHDGKTGLDLLRRERPDLTILDWLMPEMDGPMFCEQVRRDPALLSSQILMMTTQDQPEHLAEGLGRGADDFLSKAASPYELAARVQAGLRTAVLIRSLEQATAEIQRKQAVLEHELRSAAQYVESLLPNPGLLIPGVRMAHVYRPALQLGGDLFNIVHWSEHQIGLYLLDASGHGVSPALRSASLSTFLRGDNLKSHVRTTDPGAILTEANQLFPLTEDGHYFTIIFVRLDMGAQTLAYATAGHQGTIVHRRTGEVAWLTSPALPLGFDPSYEYATVELPVVPGDRLYVLSDGLYEVPSPDGELWGPARLQRTIGELGHRPLSEVIDRTIEAAEGWLGHDHFPDDVAVMGFELEAESSHPVTGR